MIKTIFESKYLNFIIFLIAMFIPSLTKFMIELNMLWNIVRGEINWFGKTSNYTFYTLD